MKRRVNRGRQLSLLLCISLPRDQWGRVSGAAVDMAVTPGGEIWHINDDMEIYRSKI